MVARGARENCGPRVEALAAARRHRAMCEPYHAALPRVATSSGQANHLPRRSGPCLRRRVARRAPPGHRQRDRARAPLRPAARRAAGAPGLHGVGDLALRGLLRLAAATAPAARRPDGRGGRGAVARADRRLRVRVRARRRARGTGRSCSRTTTSAPATCGRCSWPGWHSGRLPSVACGGARDVRGRPARRPPADARSCLRQVASARRPLAPVCGFPTGERLWQMTAHPRRARPRRSPGPRRPWTSAGREGLAEAERLQDAVEVELRQPAGEVADAELAQEVLELGRR